MPKGTVVMTGGGTLGSVTPLLGVAAELRKDGIATAWIGTADGPEQDIVLDAGIDYFAIPSGKFRRYLSLRNVADVFRIMAGTGRAYMLLGTLKPDAVVSAGGFVAVPVVWAAGMRRIPVHIHQQDWVPGLANRLSLPYAKTVSVALEKSVADYGKRAVWTGNPVRTGISGGDADAANARFALEADRPLVLVLGGSTGARGLNRMIAGAAPKLLSHAQILHVTGPGRAEGHIDGKGYVAVDFIGEGMADVYARADVVVTRAGMGTLTELAALGKPTVVVPMPDSHQEANADAYADAVTVVRESDGIAALSGAVTLLVEDAVRRTAAAAAMAAMHRQDAAARIADLIRKTAKL